MKKKIVLSFFAYILSGCWGGAGNSDVQPAPASLTKLQMIHDSAVIFNGNRTLIDFQTPINGDTSTKYSGYYYDSVSSAAKGVDIFTSSCLDSGTARLSMDRFGGMYSEYRLMVNDPFSYQGSNSATINIDSGVTGNIYISCGISSTSDLHISGTTKGTNVVDTFVFSNIESQPLLKLSDTVLDLTTSGNGCDLFTGKDALSPYHQAQISGKVVCIPSVAVGKDSSLLMLYDYNLNDHSFLLPETRAFSPNNSLYAFLYNQYKIRIKARVFTSSTPVLSNAEASRQINLLSSIETDSSDSVQAEYNYDTSLGNANYHYDSTFEISVCLPQNIHSETVVSEFCDTCFDTIVTCDSTSRDSTANKVRNKPMAANSSELLDSLNAHKAQLVNDRSAYSDFVNSLSNIKEYYFDIRLSMYNGSAQSDLQNYCSAMNSMSVYYSTFIIPGKGAITLNGLDFANTGSGYIWHIGRALPSGMAATDTGYLESVYSNKEYLLRSFDGITERGSQISNLIPSDFSQTYPIERLLSHEGYHALVGANVNFPSDVSQDLTGSSNALMLMFENISNGNGSLLMSPEQWGYLRRAVRQFQ